MPNWSFLCSPITGPITSTIPSLTPEEILVSSSLYYPIRQIQLSAAHHPLSSFTSKPSTGLTPEGTSQSGAGEPQTECDPADLALQSQIKAGKHSSSANTAPMLLAVLQLLSVVLLSLNLLRNGEEKLICIHSKA